MATQKKVETVETLKRLLSESSALLLTDYRGLGVAEIGDLRRQLRTAGAEYHVTKNTLVRRAAEEVGIKTFDGLLEGPTAIAFVREDPAKAAKVLSDFARTSRVMSIKGGWLGDRLISAEQVASLATLPPREELLGRLLGQMNAPIAGLVTVLSANISGLARVLQARADQLAAAA